MEEVPCVIARGGTSKGIFLNQRDLPDDRPQRDLLIAKLFGRDNQRQIDGLGGGDPLTSKVAILSAPTCPEVDVEYLSGEVCLFGTGVNYGITCGNLLSAVGPAAARLGILNAEAFGRPITVHSRNSNSCIRVEYPAEAYCMAGRPMDARLIFEQPAGVCTGQLLPTGSAEDRLKILGKTVDFSVVDAGSVYAFLDAGQLGISGGTPRAIDEMCELKSFVEAFREQVTELLNQRLSNSTPMGTGSVKVALVADPEVWSASCERGFMVGDHGGDPSSVDIVGRILNRANTHKAYAVSGAIATSVASSIEGTVPNRLRSSTADFDEFRIGHPEGVLRVRLTFADTGGAKTVKDARLTRSARILMCGTGFAG
jgi:2-methylaconitate cis-trans-isomerase PrpF